MTIKKTLIALALVSVSAFSHAVSDSQLFAARDAYRANDLAQLASLNNPADRDILAAWPAYWYARKALEAGNDAPARAELTNPRQAYLQERLINEWINILGKDSDWPNVQRLSTALAPEARDNDTVCWNDIATLNRNQSVPATGRQWQDIRLGDACTRLLEEQARRGLLSPALVDARMRLLLSNNYLTVARSLATAANLGQRFFTPTGNEQLAQQILTLAKTNPVGALERVNASEAQLGKATSGFVYGQIAIRLAQRLNMPQALDAFERADPQQLTDDQWEWWMRAALRLQDWPRLEALTRAAPEDIRNESTWQYWRARSLHALGRQNEATPLLITLSFEHSYYGLLAKEELGTVLDAPTTRQPTSPELNRQVLADPNIRHALALFDLAERSNRNEWREDARRVWSWALRGKSDEQLLAAAEIALDRHLYDIAINSATRTVRIHDFNLRFLSPYRDITRRYAQQLNIDDAWVYGLMRQESRFLNVARSHVGASGLMQIMPSTAKWIAGKMGIKEYEVNDIDTNIKFGTWYLRHAMDTLSGHPVLATAAYNAGPNRARSWQAATPLEGAIYAETIPFTETREYVQKVMTNAVYYAGAFRQPGNTLKARMGTIPPR